MLRDEDGEGPYTALADAQAAGAVTLNVGLFLNAVVSFTIVAFVVFLLVRTISRMKREEAIDPTEKHCPSCFMVVPIKAVRCGHCTSELAADGRVEILSDLAK